MNVRSVRKRAVFEPLTDEQEELIRRLTRQGQSSRYIASKLGVPSDRIERERKRLRVRSNTQAGNRNGAYERRLKPKHITAPYSPEHGEWWDQNNRAFERAMLAYHLAGGRIINVVE